MCLEFISFLTSLDPDTAPAGGGTFLCFPILPDQAEISELSYPHTDPNLLGGITNSLVQGNNMHEYSKGQLEQHRKEPLRWGDKIDSSPPGLLEEVVGLLNFWCTRNQALI